MCEGMNVPGTEAMDSEPWTKLQNRPGVLASQHEAAAGAVEVPARCVFPLGADGREKGQEGEVCLHDALYHSGDFFAPSLKASAHFLQGPRIWRVGGGWAVLVQGKGQELVSKGYNPELPVLQGGGADILIKHAAHLVKALAGDGHPCGRQLLLAQAARTQEVVVLVDGHSQGGSALRLRVALPCSPQSCWGMSLRFSLCQACRVPGLEKGSH